MGRSPSLTFLGGAGTVTGSRFLVESPTAKVLVDAGLYQGLAPLRRRNWEPFPVDPATLDAVLVTHAHLDHCGFLPRLVREGFSGRVLCTPQTGELAAIVLRDSAHLLEEEAEYANAVGFSRHRPALPLYDSGDVERTLPLVEPVGYDDPLDVTADVRALFRPAGHILGSAVVRLDVDGSTVLVSGDLGRASHPIAAPRAVPPSAETVVVESTYGDRSHHPEPDGTLLGDAVRRTVERGGSVLVPAFAVDRTELVLLALGRQMRDGTVPAVPVFLDSPMALAALDVYRRAPEGAGIPPGFGVPDLRMARTVSDSERLNRPSRPCVVISASGMATGGRVLHHLTHQLPDPRNCVVLTGYQAEGTRGRALVEGAPHLKIHGRYVPVRAEVVDDRSFSVHADGDELLTWLGQLPEPPRTVYAVHGEPPASEALCRRIASELGWNAVTPGLGERVRLD